MLQTYEGLTDDRGKLLLLDSTQLPPKRRVLITILSDEAELTGRELALLSESALAQEWSTVEEDEAWAHLPQLPSL